MLLCVSRVLDAGTLARVGGLLDAAPWRDGAATARGAAAAAKRNRQVDPSSRAAAELAALVAPALLEHDVVRAAALPARLGPLLFAEAGPGEGYGAHLDEPLMNRGEPLRTDLAFTLFLTPPDSYDGGELVVIRPDGERAVKLEAGALALYPATFLHRVETVARGRRRVAAGWIQSLVRDAGARELLFELATAIAEAAGTKAVARLELVRANLLRRWAET